MQKGTALALLCALATRAALADAAETVDQSQLASDNAQPIGSPLNDDRKRRLDTPEVVLSVKYEGGSIDGIYLAQYRKGLVVSSPATPEGTSLCLDLCHAGLGGDGCGSSCRDLVPVGLLQMTSARSDHGEGSSEHANETNIILEEASSSSQIGDFRPRMEVCPALCANNLGYPLCGCPSDSVVPSHYRPNWGAVCSSFCSDGGYALRGCPPCEAAVAKVTQQSTRVLDTTSGWKAWCNVQCLQGQGGAACNCDRAPFSM